jgi:hypothetical protein
MSELLSSEVRVLTRQGRVICYRIEGDKCLVVREKELSREEKNLRVSLSI